MLSDDFLGKINEKTVSKNVINCKINTPKNMSFNKIKNSQNLLHIYVKMVCLSIIILKTKRDIFLNYFCASQTLKFTSDVKKRVIKISMFETLYL